ncbi:hypothetical protein EVA_11445 [gut metagenome]|uniref:Uncharacterized protein n=1 Tax=gut metagenome TaxID=749906 RepID=J9G0U1_9ZZZZ
MRSCLVLGSLGGNNPACPHLLGKLQLPLFLGGLIAQCSACPEWVNGLRRAVCVGADFPAVAT